MHMATGTADMHFDPPLPQISDAAVSKTVLLLFSCQ